MFISVFVVVTLLFRAAFELRAANPLSWCLQVTSMRELMALDIYGILNTISGPLPKRGRLLLLLVSLLSRTRFSVTTCRLARSA